MRPLAVRLPFGALIRARLGAFAGDTRGSVTIEAVIMLPILVWAYCALFTFFDAYRQTSINEKAASTISDMISRESDPLNDSFLDGTFQMLNFLTRSSAERRMRVSIIRFDQDDNAHRVEWSHVRGTVTALDTGSIGDWSDKLPAMVDQEILILVETWTDYTAPFPIVGLNDRTIQTFVFTRPRDVMQRCWETCA